MSFGTAKSRLVEVIDTQHADIDLSAADRERIRLSADERRAITTWIDLNCPLWNDYSPQRHAKVGQ